ncbi:MAG: T9SS type A sorting domain-containing protein, partial [Bacteroidota bacterium]
EYNNEVLKLDDFTSDTTLVGYIVGGIYSSAANIFWMNDGTQSNAASQIFKSYLVKNSKSGNHKLNPQSIGTLHLQVYPDIENQNFEFHFNLENNSEVTLSIGDANGRILQSSVLRNLNPGKNSASLNMMNLSEGAYFITIETTYEKAEQKIIIEP